MREDKVQEAKVGKRGIPVSDAMWRVKWVTLVLVPLYTLHPRGALPRMNLHSTWGG